MTWVAVSIFTVLSLAAAWRLLAVWRRSRELPELLIALLILGVGTVAVGLGFLLRPILPPSAATAVPLLGASMGMGALAVFNWKVYRPRSGAARAALAGVGIGLVITLFSALVHDIRSEPAALGIARSAIYVGVMAWSAIEALAFWGSMRRRRELGLADPVVTNRVLLWGLATGVSALGIFIGALAQYVVGVRPEEASWVTLVYASHGSVGAICFWLAFAPPASYERRLRSRATAGPAAPAG